MNSPLVILLFIDLAKFGEIWRNLLLFGISTSRAVFFVITLNQVRKWMLDSAWYGLTSRDSGNNFHFPDFALHTGRFGLFFVSISLVVSFRVDIQQLSHITMQYYIH